MPSQERLSAAGASSGEMAHTILVSIDTLLQSPRIVPLSRRSMMTSSLLATPALSQIVLEVPVKVVECRAVSREITFHSKKEISNFSVIQRVMTQQRISADKRARPKWICLEEWVTQLVVILYEYCAPEYTYTCYLFSHFTPNVHSPKCRYFTLDLLFLDLLIHGRVWLNRQPTSRVIQLPLQET